MSHSVPIKTIFKNQKALFSALLALGWGIKERATCRTYPSDPKRNTIHPYVAVNPMTNGYDVGFTILPEEIIADCDFFGGSIEKSLGKGFCKLKTEYVKEVAKENGYIDQVILEMYEDGSLILEVDDRN